MNNILQKITNCLVIGGCGFLGGHIVEHLLEKGYNVSVFDIRKTFDNDKVTFFIGDICNKDVSYDRQLEYYTHIKFKEIIPKFI
jgi:nucleoside-diphosphate-sugar epimerase